MSDIRIEAWEFEKTTGRASHYKVRATSAPASEVGGETSVLLKRSLATVFMATPAGLLFWWLRLQQAGGGSPAVPGLLLVAYGIYLKRSFRYTWSDLLLYGLSWRFKLAGKIAWGGNALKVSVRFPVGRGQAVARALLLAGLAAGVWNFGPQGPPKESKPSVVPARVKLKAGEGAPESGTAPEPGPEKASEP